MGTSRAHVSIIVHVCARAGWSFDLVYLGVKMLSWFVHEQIILMFMLAQEEVSHVTWSLSLVGMYRPVDYKISKAS